MKHNVIMGLLAHLICLNYFLLRSVKDALVVPLYNSVDILPLLKVGSLIPLILILGLLFVASIRRIGHKSISSLLLLAYAIIFALWKFVSPSMLYIAAELWNVVALTMIFWGYASLMSKRSNYLYPFYLLCGSAGALVSSQLVSYLLTKGLWINGIFMSASLISLVILSIYRSLSTHSSKIKLPQYARGALRTIFSSNMLLLLGILQIGEYVLLQLVELKWKKGIYLTFPEPVKYCAYMNSISRWVGIVAFISTLLSPLFLRYFSSKKLILVTPVYGLLCALILPDTLFFGAVYTIFFRAARQALGTSTREMIYLDLSTEEKVVGKALVCSLSPSIGKVFVALGTLSTCWVIGVGLMIIVAGGIAKKVNSEAS